MELGPRIRFCWHLRSFVLLGRLMTQTDIIGKCPPRWNIEFQAGCEILNNISHLFIYKLQWRAAFIIEKHFFTKRCIRLWVHPDPMKPELRCNIAGRVQKQNSSCGSTINSLAPGRFGRNFIRVNWSWFPWMLAGVSLMRLPLDKRHWSVLMISQRWFRYGLLPSGNKSLSEPMLTQMSVATMT